MKKPELLIPAGSLDVLKTAVLFGADAVYIGGELFSLRAKAKNFSDEDMAEAVRFCHENGCKIYITANITAHNYHMAGVREYFARLKELGPDALIISDPGVFRQAREICPEIPVHISTQANNVNAETFLFWYDLGVRRVVCGRELSLEEIAEIRRKIPEDMEIEAFVHGAMCISYSGRCLLSNFMTGRDANLGACTHPCRWKYYLMEETRPDEYFPVEENEDGTYIFNSKDLCMIEHIPELCMAGIDSFKVEGRMKTALYVATVAGTYRKAIDDYTADPELFTKNLPLYREEIEKSSYRSYTTGFFFGKPGPDAQIYDSQVYERNYKYLGTVESVAADGSFVFEQKNKFAVGDTIEILSPGFRHTETAVRHMFGEDGTEVTSCPHPKEMITAIADAVPKPGDILRMRDDGE
ncbi:MAG: U32 family peptidase [Lachnospiraceae bacterium]|nr:U32 family peptidase [Lachnospiraceae bacterium]